MFSYLVYSRDTVVYIRVWKTFPRLLCLDERCVLFIFQSPYFASMFSGAWKESAMEKIDIEIMDDNINEEC